MEAFFGWIRNLTFYLIFITVIINLLPAKKYETYLRFFFGMVFLLLVIQPFTKGIHIEERLAYYFQTISLQNEAGELQKELLGVETIRLEQMFSRYEEAVGEDIRQLAENGGFHVFRANVSLGRDSDSQDFGKVTSIALVLAFKDSGTSSGEWEKEKDPIQPVEQVEPVVIGEEQQDVPVQEQRSEPEDAAVVALRRQLLNFYDLEESNVEIQLENRQG